MASAAFVAAMRVIHGISPAAIATAPVKGAYANDAAPKGATAWYLANHSVPGIKGDTFFGGGRKKCLIASWKG